MSLQAEARSDAPRPRVGQVNGGLDNCARVAGVALALHLESLTLP